MKCSSCGLTSKKLAKSEIEECPDCGAPLTKNDVPNTLLQK